MKLDEALRLAKQAHVAAIQPEGKAVAEAYEAGDLRFDIDALHLIAFLLHEVSVLEAAATGVES